MSQLPLPFAHAPRYGLDDFLPAGSNAAALAAIERWPAWPDPVLVLIGPEGSGKSHLARIWAERADAAILKPDAVGDDVATVSRHNGVIDDVDRAGVSEAGLFHLLNLVREGASSLLLTARTAPAAWPIVTPDLLSRLRLAPTVEILAPDDDLMRAVLVKLFADRQLVVDAGLVDYLARHLDRSLDAGRRAVAELDRASLDAGRRISRTLAARLFCEPRLDDD